MFKIRAVDVSGLWSDRSIRLELHPDVNFLIGGNGTGKTTIINLVAAALTADFSTLSRIDFADATIALEDREASVSVRLVKSGAPSQSGDVSYTLSGGERVEEFRLPNPGRYRTLSGLFSPTPIGLQEPGIEERLRELVELHWLPVQRMRGKLEDETSHEPTLDAKLSQLEPEFTKLFSRLANQRSMAFIEFAEFVFLSTIDLPSFQELAQDFRIVDVELEKDDFAKVLETLWLKHDQYGPGLERLFVSLHAAAAKDAGGEALTSDEVGALYAAARLRKLTSEWQNMNSRQQEAVLPRTRFLEMINVHFRGKSLDVNTQNELIVRAGDGRSLLLKQLSSGEKQLIILLAEALLQRQAETIYVADEPEISLHVNWQETLIGDLLELNENMQLIIATQSPDIIGAFPKNVISMEESVVRWP
jgi:predicted ATPase